MSRATEIAKAEADEAEAENPDAEPVEPIEPDEPTEEEIAEEEETTSEPSSLAQVENIDKALETESRRHAKALAKALGDQWEHFAMCPLCQVDGYAMPYQPGEVSAEQRQAILTVMGEGTPQYREHPTEVRCPTCDGYGEMVNGSRRPEQATSACQDCMGTGHRDKASMQSNVAQLPTPPSYPWDTHEPTSPPMPNTDQWGRPQNHPDFGLDPVAIVSTVRSA